MPHLILVRHGESTWNALGKWAGLTDIPLTEQGMTEARQAAKYFEDIPLHAAYVSDLLRAWQTLDEIRQTLAAPDLPTTVHAALNERDYGQLTGKVKREFKRQVGNEAYRRVSRSWDQPAPGGESLKTVYKRVVGYYQDAILTDLLAGKNVLVVSHHNPLRALIKYLEGIPDSAIADLEMGTSSVYVYAVDGEGAVVGKKIQGGNDSYLH